MAENVWARLRRINGGEVTVRIANVAAFAPRGDAHDPATILWVVGRDEPFGIAETVEDVARALGAA